MKKKIKNFHNNLTRVRSEKVTTEIKAEGKHRTCIQSKHFIFSSTRRILLINVKLLETFFLRRREKIKVQKRERKPSEM